MSLACAVLVVRLCVPADYAPAVEQTRAMVSVYPRKTPRKTHGVIVTTVQSDFISTAPASGFDKACEKDRCVYYLKHCEPRPLVCEYVYAMPGLYGGAEPRGGFQTLHWEQLRIATDSTAALRRAEAALSLTLDGDLRMPLARLAVERPSTAVPFCGIDPEPGCPDSPRMAQARAERAAYRARKAERK